MTSHQPGDVPEPGADGGTTLPAAGLRLGRRLIAVMLLAAAALDLARCGIVLATARQSRQLEKLTENPCIDLGSVRSPAVHPARTSPR
jgi:hypothetical protein